MSEPLPSIELRDAKGDPHAYVIGLHNPTEGTAIALRLVGSVADPLMRLLGQRAVLEKALAAFKDSGAADPAALMFDALGSIDIANAGVDVAKVIDGLGPKFIRDVLQFTTRDGAPLSQDVHFNAAYRGNYFEMFRAVVEVCKVNRFLPLPTT